MRSLEFARLRTGEAKRKLDPQRALSLLLAATLLVGCAQMQSAEQSIENNPKAVLGSVIGAGAGALLVGAMGGKGGAVVAGALVGGLLGGYVGHRLDEKDKQMAAAAAAVAAFEQNRSGQAAVWNNPDSGNHGSITPTHTYQLATGQYCREYTQDVWIGGEKQQTYGTACRQADGTWKVQDS